MARVTKKTVRKSPVRKVLESKPLISGNATRLVSPEHVGPMRRRSRSPLAGVWGLIAWLVGILVSLAVGSGMIGETLTIPYIPGVVTVVAGWLVVVLTLVGVLLKIIDLAS